MEADLKTGPQESSNLNTNMWSQSSDRAQASFSHWQPQTSPQAFVHGSPKFEDGSLGYYLPAISSTAGHNNLGQSYLHISKHPQKIQCWGTSSHDNAESQTNRKFVKLSEVTVSQPEQSQHFCDKALCSTVLQESIIDHAKPAQQAIPYKASNTLSSRENAEYFSESLMPSNCVCILDNLQEATKRSNHKSVLSQNFLQMSIPKSAAIDSNMERNLSQLSNTHCTVNLWRLTESELPHTSSKDPIRKSKIPHTSNKDPVRKSKIPHTSNKYPMHNSSSQRAAVSTILPHTLKGTVKDDERTCFTNTTCVRSLDQFCYGLGKRAGRHHPLSQSCHCKQFKCADKLSKTWQRQLRCQFWKSDIFHKRKEWMLNHIVDWKNNHLLPQTKTISRRKSFMMSDSTGNLIKVCRGFFLQTLSYKWSSILHFLLKDSLRLKRNCISKCHKLKNLSSRSDKHVKLLILMHIKSFLKKYHSQIQASNGSLRNVHDYSLVKRSFHSFTVTYPSLGCSYQVFRNIFYTIFDLFCVDSTYLSIMPPVLLLRQAYQKYDLLNGQQDTSLETSKRALVESLTQSNIKIINPKVQKIIETNKRRDENTKVVMYLDVDNDNVVITENASDSDTDNEVNEIITLQTEKTGDMKQDLCSKTSQPYNSNKEIKLQMEHTKEEHPMLPNCKCRRQCFTKISEARRKEIYTSFWELRDCIEQKHWVETHTEGSHHRRRLKGRKRVRKSYFLIDETNKSVSVCAVYFQRTLGFTGARWFNSLCSSYSGEAQDSCLNHTSRKEHVDRIDGLVRRCVEQHVKSHTALTDNGNKNTSKSLPGASSPGWSVKTLHSIYLTSHPDFPISFGRFQVIYHQVCKSSFKHSGTGGHKNTNSDSLILVHQPIRGRNLRKCNRSLFQNAERKDPGMPKRRRSTRTTRMQGSLAEDNFSEFDGESGTVSSIVSTQNYQCAKENTDKSCPEVKLKLCPNYSINHLIRRSSKSTRSFKAVDKKVFNKSVGPIMEEQCPKSIQVVDKSELNPGSNTQQRKCKNKKRSMACKRQRKKRKEDLKKESEDLLLSSIKSQAKTAQILKRNRQLKSLKNKHKHPLLPPCNCSRRRCSSNIPDERRKEIHEHFWNLSSYGDRKRWLMKYVEKRERKIQVLSLFPQRKNESKKYFLPDGKGQPIEVCRLFFIHTLGFKWDSGVDVIVKTKSSIHVAEQSHQSTKPAHQLPDYITESVKQYLTSIRDSQNSTRDPETVSGAQNEVLDEYKNEDLPGLKVKDLFKGWKVKFKSLKFNLGYHSFRRIFQTVVDPAGDTRREVTDKTVNSKNSADVDTLVDDDVNEHFTQLLPQTEASSTSDGLQNHENVSTEDHLDNGELWANVSGKTDTDTTTSRSGLSVPSCAENELKRQPVHEDGNDGVVKNYISCSEHSTEDTDNCVLDVSSGFFKQADVNDKHYPYNHEYQCKKRRSLSTRNDRSNYPVLPPCKCRKRKCSDKFTEVHRQHINDTFWNLSGYNERKQWILEHIKRADIKRRVVFTEGTPRKLESRWYYLPDADGNKIDVCKAFFLRTLGYRWDSVIDTIGKTTPKGDKWVVPDKRGRKPPPHKISQEAVSSMTLYIENVCHTYQPLCSKKNQDSLKEGKASPASLIPFGLTMKQLFEDYKSKHQSHKFGYESFRKVFRRVHGAYLASLPPAYLESSEEAEEAYPEMTASVDKDYAGSAHVECSGSFQTEDSHFIATTESYTNLSQYTTPRPPSLPPLPPPPSSHHHEPHQILQLVGSSVPERRSCLYQYNHQSCQPQPLQSLPAVQVPDAGPSLQPDRYNSLDHDPFMKYNHNLYCQPSGMHGHFSQMGDHMSYSTGLNPRATDTIDPSTCGGTSQFPPYFIPSPEPLRRQVYHMASQYQSILHQIAESSRFFNYGGFPPPDTASQGGHDRQYQYTKQQDFTRDDINSYNIPKTSHNFVSMSSNIPTQYPPVHHLPQNNLQQGNTSMLLSPYSNDNDNNFTHNHNGVPGVTTMITSFGHECIAETNDKKPDLKERASSKKQKTNSPKIKKENKLRPKSARNYGDHYPMLSPCNCKKKKCTEIFSESDRRRVHDMFWDLKDYNERKQWMLLHIKREDCKRRRIDQFESFRKQESRWYFFPDEEGHQHEVCKDFFLRTLGYKWDSVIDTIRRTTPKGETSSRPDQRGRKAPAHKLSNIVLRSVVQYIESMQQVSQPLIASCNAGSGPLEKMGNPSCGPSSVDASSSNQDISSEQIAVPYGLTMKDLYDDYKAKHVGHKIGYESFRRIFRALSKSEKIVFDDRTTDDDILNNHDLVDF